MPARPAQSRIDPQAAGPRPRSNPLFSSWASSPAAILTAGRRAGANTNRSTRVFRSDQSNANPAGRGAAVRRLADLEPVAAGLRAATGAGHGPASARGQLEDRKSV